MIGTCEVCDALPAAGVKSNVLVDDDAVAAGADGGVGADTDVNDACDDVGENNVVIGQMPLTSVEGAPGSSSQIHVSCDMDVRNK